MKVTVKNLLFRPLILRAIVATSGEDVRSNFNCRLIAARTVFLDYLNFSGVSIKLRGRTSRA